MKADEIRAIHIEIVAKTANDGIAQASVHLVSAGLEIAAQLAELNEARRPVWLEFTRRGREVMIDVGRVVEVYADETRVTYLHLLGEDHDQDCFVDGTVAAVMARIGAARMEGKA
jgi:hypothetical protein